MTSMQDAVRAFLEREAELLDERRFREWLGLFADDAYYWIPVSPDQSDPRASPSHVFERWPVLAARVERLYDSRVVPQQPASRTSRILGTVQVDGSGGEAAVVLARVKFHLVESRATHEAESEQRVFAGTARYALAHQENAFKIQWKRVDLIDSEAGARGITVIF